MDKIKEDAYEILDIVQKIYEKQEKDNPTSIFRDKVFFIGTENNRESISIERDIEKKDSTYYFETSEIRGAIIKRESGNYCVKSAVKYPNADNEDLWFAKIRIENSYDKDIQIMGVWGGSWQQPDGKDENLITNPNSALPFALDSMKNYLVDIYDQLCKNNELDSDLYDPDWVRKLKRYNI